MVQEIEPGYTADDYLTQDDYTPISVPSVDTMLPNWRDSMMEKAIDEVVNTTPDGEEELEGEENYDIELPKSSFNNAQMALDATEQMHLFTEEQEMPELGDMVLKMTTYLESLRLKSSRQSSITDFFSAGQSGIK